MSHLTFSTRKFIETRNSKQNFKNKEVGYKTTKTVRNTKKKEIPQP